MFSAVPMIQRLDNTLRSGAVPQAAAQFTPSPTLAQPTTNKPPSGKSDNQTTEAKNVTVKPAAAAAAAIGKQSSLSAGDARAKVQEEITREFEAIMATGTLRASEAAALATRRIMQKHGHLKSTSMSQG